MWGYALKWWLFCWFLYAEGFRHYLVPALQRYFASPRVITVMKGL